MTPARASSPNEDALAASTRSLNDLFESHWESWMK